MQCTLNVRQLLRQGGEGDGGEASFHFSNKDFLGFKVTKPVRLTWRARPSADVLRLELKLDAVIDADCVRCLQPFSRQQHFEKTYDIQVEDLEGAYPEYPTTPEGYLDLEEMAYEELVLEVSPILHCSEDCQGLCTQCGKPLNNCTCTDEAKLDPRWQALWHLLDNGE